MNFILLNNIESAILDLLREGLFWCKIGCSTVWLYVLLTFCTLEIVNAQPYTDHFGTGNYVGMTISSSSDSNASNTANYTVNGTGYISDMVGASRLLGQATLGAKYEEIAYAQQIGLENWIDEQMTLQGPSFQQTYRDIYTDMAATLGAVHGADHEKIEPLARYINSSFYTKVIEGNDLLRQKTAFALSQIFVVSYRPSVMARAGYGIADYYDLMYEGAFGNFRDLLRDISLHPIMGLYLSHYANEKENLALGTKPDENFAREIMQLFSIGLQELNMDGTPKLDASGRPIPTYDIVDIQELAKVFTGLSIGAIDVEARPDLAGIQLLFTRPHRLVDKTVPMKMYEDYHDRGPKIMMDGSVLPAGQSGMKDIEDAIDVLFNHDNVGPFIARRLIQQMVTSNPSPGYIRRVAMAFNNNGEGVRGDMGAVFRAILLDPEARNCEWIESNKSGRLKQPMERYVHLYRALDLKTPSGRYWFRDETQIYDLIEQAFLFSPSVFNFFTPFYAESSIVEPNNMTSPEFQILHDVSSIRYINHLFGVIQEPFENHTLAHSAAVVLVENLQDKPYLDYTPLVSMLNTQGPSALVDRLDMVLCQGQMSVRTKEILIETIDQLSSNGYDAETQVKNAIIFTMASPDYLIQQ